MKYKNWMDNTWTHADQTHQLDPLSIVDDPNNKDQQIELYKILGMATDKAIEISSAWRLKQVRMERDRLIAETDWWVLPDRNPTQEQLTYRQALRDITQNFNPLVEVEFPQKPE